VPGNRHDTKPEEKCAHTPWSNGCMSDLLDSELRPPDHPVVGLTLRGCRGGHPSRKG
jgi:hypothetical protein